MSPADSKTALYRSSSTSCRSSFSAGCSAATTAFPQAGCSETVDLPAGLLFVVSVFIICLVLFLLVAVLDIIFMYFPVIKFLSLIPLSRRSRYQVLCFTVIPFYLFRPIVIQAADSYRHCWRLRGGLKYRNV